MLSGMWKYDILEGRKLTWLGIELSIQDDAPGCVGVVWLFTTTLVNLRCWYNFLFCGASIGDTALLAIRISTSISLSQMRSLPASVDMHAFWFSGN